MSQLQSTDDRRADFEAGFGITDATASDIYGEYKCNEISAGGNRNITWKPKTLGILNSTSYLPLSLISGPLVLEMTFHDDPRAGTDNAGESESSTVGFSVSEIQCHVDVLAVDPAFLTTLSQHLMAQNSLNISYRNVNTSFYSILSASSQITHARSASRLNDVMLTFGRADGVKNGDKQQTNMLFPTGNSLKARLQVGEKRVPATTDLRGAAVFYRTLMNTQGSKPFSITREKFEKNAFVVAFDLETAPAVQHSGISTANAPAALFLEDLYSGTSVIDGTNPNAVFLHTSSDALLEISKRGVVLSN